MLFNNITKVVPQERKETRGRKFIVDEHIKVCTKCDRVWEKLNKRIHNITYTVYPFDVIPRIGKAKAVCPRCKK